MVKSFQCTSIVNISKTAFFGIKNQPISLIIKNLKVDKAHFPLIKAVTLAFSSIYAEFGIPNSLQYSDIWQNSDGGISDFQISDQSLIKENYKNSRTSETCMVKHETCTTTRN